MGEDDFATAFANAIMGSMIDHADAVEHAYKNPPTERPPQKFAIGEEVIVNSWGGRKEAIITGVDWIFHNRGECWCWGYSVDRGTGFSFHFIPEGYFQKKQEG